jgi:integrase/recombinase XerD
VGELHIDQPDASNDKEDTFTMHQLLDAFFVHLSADGTTPAGTLKAYRTDLTQCMAFLADRGITEIDRLQPDDLHAYCAWLEAQGYATATIARRIVALRAFSAFVVTAGTLATDPCADLTPPVVRRTVRQALTIAQIDTLRAMMLRAGTPDGWRDRAVLEVLLATALRASDLVALDIGDIDLDSASVTLRGSAGKTRTLTLAPEAQMALVAYLQLGRPKLLRGQVDHGALFLNQQGERLTRQGCWVVLKVYADALELDDLSPELIRQSVAALRFADGASVDEVQALLGHTVRKTTMVYQPAAVTARAV